MHGKNLIKKFSMSADELSRLTSEALGSTTLAELDTAIGKTVAELAPNKIVRGKVIKVLEDGVVVVDVNYKAEGQISLEEFPDPTAVQPGLEIECLVEQINDSEGYILLSKRKADRIRGWENIIQTHKEGDSVKGMVLRKIKGGLLVDIGVPVFLPASQVNIRRAGDIGDWIGKDIEARIIKIDEERMNIVISRRKLIEEERETKKAQLLAELAEGQIRKGIVKNIADFGVFVDLGGIDGLLHITDLAWRRVKHPSEVLNVGDEVTAKVLKFDSEKNRVSLGLKQLGEDPWVGIARRYPQGTRLFGKVTNLTDYGAFVEVESGIEGLVHVSEMDWTNKNVHPSKVVQVGDEVEVMILEIDEERRRISLGMKQCMPNPWEDFAREYKKGDKVKGQIKSITDFGVFVGLPGGIDGLVHLSDLSWSAAGEEAVKNFKKSEEVEAVVLSIDIERERISLGIKQLEGDPFTNFIASHEKNSVVSGTVKSVDAKGAVIDIGGVEGYLRASEFSRDRVDDLAKHLKEGDSVQAMIINLDRKNRSINVSVKAKDMAEETEAMKQLRTEQAAASAGATNLGALLRAKLDKKDGNPQQ